MMELRIERSVRPKRLGAICVLDETAQIVLGPFSVAGRLRDESSRELGSDGILPGDYKVQGIFPMAGASLSDIREFGRHGLIALAPAAHAGSGAPGSESPIYIHGGARGPDGLIRSSSDSMRLDDRHLHQLVKLLANSEDVKVRVKRCITDTEVASAPASTADSGARSIGKVLAALPLAFAAIPGLFPATSEAQTQQCTVYDTGTNFSAVDFSMINLQVGGDALEGYVPNSSSGVTIAGGLDLGIYTSAQLTSMGFNSAQVTAWTPYLATSCGSVVGSAAAAILNANPLVVTPDSAASIDIVYYSASANSMGSLYNQLVTQYNIIPGHTFAELPLQYQTAMTAMDLTNTSFGTSLACQLLAKGEWTSAITALKDYGSSSAAVNKLAALYAAYMAKAPEPTF